MPKDTNYSKLFSTYLNQDIPENYEGEMILDCPFGIEVGGICENPTQHFYANTVTSEWHCKRCDQSGNARQLLTAIHQQYYQQTTDAQLQFISSLRKISIDILRDAGFAFDPNNDRWYVPYFTYDPQGKKFTPWLNNLGYFHPSASKAPFVVKKASGLPLYLYNPGLHTTPHTSKEAIILEGEWDTLKYYDDFAGTEDLVLGKPGAGFPQTFLKTLAYCNGVTLMLDNDTPGLKQQAKAILVLKDRRPPFTIRVLDHSLMPKDKNRRAGLINPYSPKDYRDISVERPTTVKQEIQNAIVPYDESDISIPDTDDDQTTLTAGYVRDASVFTPVTSFQEYIAHQRTIFEISEETRLAQAAATAITISHSIPGEPLWAFLISPPSSGKTIYIESHGGTNQWFDSLDKLTYESFVSGWRSDSGADSSYLPNLRNKTLFVKDFTTTLMGPDEQQRKLFGLLTSVYDGHVKIPFGNEIVREYHDIYFNMIAGVTDIVHAHSAASIGERFLRIDWLGKHYDARAFARRAMLNFGQSNQHKTLFTEWTLGFQKYLREQTIDLHVDEAYIEPLLDLAAFIAIIRTKVESDRHEGIKYKPRAELPARLAKQLAKLFVAAKVVTGSPEEAFLVARKVALDTSYGFPMEIVQFLIEHPSATRDEISAGTGIHAQRAYRVLTDLVTTKVITNHSVSSGTAGRQRLQYRLNSVLLPALQPSKYIIAPDKRMNYGNHTEHLYSNEPELLDHENRPINRRPGPPRPSNGVRPRIAGPTRPTRPVPRR